MLLLLLPFLSSTEQMFLAKNILELYWTDNIIIANTQLTTICGADLGGKDG